MPARKPMPDPAPPSPDIEAEMPINFVPTAPGVPVRKSMIPELYHFVRSLPADMPYADLAGAAQSAGWIWRLVERDNYAASPNLYLVRFEVLIGKATADMELEHFDTISMSVPAEAPSPSLIARLNAAVTLMYMVFGRLPPQQMPQQMPQPAPQPAPVEPEPEPQFVEDEIVPWSKPKPKAVEVVLSSRRTPDGLPVFSNLYDMDADASAIVAAALGGLQEALDDIDEQAKLTALWNKNGEAVEFIKDFGSVNDKAALKAMFKNRADNL